MGVTPEVDARIFPAPGFERFGGRFLYHANRFFQGGGDTLSGVAIPAYNAVIMKTLPEQKLREIRENFEYFDKGNKGYINFEEFSDLLAVISPESTTRQAAEGFSMIDTNSDGHVDLDEFVAWWQTTWWEF